ncbi:MAG: hypothetical protein M1833_001328 [Piccolia ochrophora]|nr:MAG: hypothetical protein M1833_001328 [Piccolia ochrophora]
MTSNSAVRCVLNATTKSSKSSKLPTATIHLVCHVKPGASSKREGIIAVEDSQIELCVAAQAREGEANKAVRELISDVRLNAPKAYSLLIRRQTLGVSKSSVDIAKGHKSREKTVVITDVPMEGDVESCQLQVRQKLEDAIGTW